MKSVYSTVATLKNFGGITETTRDDDLLLVLDAASRSIDDYTGTHFYIESAIRYFDGPGSTLCMQVDDLQSVSAVGLDTDGDGVFDDESWVEGTDYLLARYGNYNDFPYNQIIIHPNGSYYHKSKRYAYKITGVWGYGNGTSSPTTSTSVTGTVADDTSTSLTISVSDGLEIGSTILIETEQMLVTNVSGTTATVQRGHNGTTAASHSGAAISLYVYPGPVEQLVLNLASEAYLTSTSGGLQSETIGDWSRTFAKESSTSIDTNPLFQRVLSRYMEV